MSSNSSSQAEYIWSVGRRLKAAFTVAVLMVLVASVIRLVQGLTIRADLSSLAIKLAPGLTWKAPFALHFGWDFVAISAWALVLVMLMTGPTSEQSSADECVDTMTLSVVLGVVSGLAAAFVGLCAVLVAGFLCGCLRSGSVRRTTFVGNVLLAPAYGSLVVGLTVVILLGFTAGVAATAAYFLAHLGAVSIALVFGIIFPIKDGRTFTRRLRNRFQSWVISYGGSKGPFARRLRRRGQRPRDLS